MAEMGQIPNVVRVGEGAEHGVRPVLTLATVPCKPAHLAASGRVCRRERVAFRAGRQFVCYDNVEWEMSVSKEISHGVLVVIRRIDYAVTIFSDKAMPSTKAIQPYFCNRLSQIFSPHATCAWDIKPPGIEEYSP